MNEMTLLENKFSPSTHAGTSSGPPPLQRLNPRHHKIIDLYLEGFTQKEIAGLMNMTPVGIGIIVSDQRVQDEMARRRGMRERKIDDMSISESTLARDTINSLSLRAAEKLGEIVENDQASITDQRLAAKHILDKAFGEDGSSSSNRPAVVINVEQMNVLNQALEKCGYSLERGNPAEAA